MAMTKSEREEMACLRHEVSLAKALRYSSLPSPEMILPPEYGTSTSGWIMNSYSGIVGQAWSENASHGSGAKRIYGQTGSQRGISLYLSKLDAFIGLRLAKEREFAEVLSKIDVHIDAERKLLKGEI